MKSHFSLRLLVLILVLALGAALVPLANVQAATDVPCNTTALVNAIQDAVNGGGTHTLKLAQDCSYVLSQPNFAKNNTNATGLPKIRQVKLTLKGNGATIQRDANAPPFRILYVDEGGQVTLQNLTLTGGKTPDGKAGEGGGDGGAIYNKGTLKLDRVTVSNNSTGKGSDATTATGGGFGGGSGGGIANLYGELLIDSSTLSHNKTGDGGKEGANGSTGYGAGVGGGIVNLHGKLRIVNSTISSNETGNSTIKTTHGGYGGAIYSVSNTFITLLTNSTISGNRAGSGGTFGKSGGLSGDYVITNSTIANNEGSKGSSPDAATKARVDSITGGATLRNTLIANNGTVPNCKGAMTNGGNNLDTGTSCGFGSANGSKSSADPNLGPLADNGGATLTHAFQKPSDAFNRGNNDVCNSDPVNKLDQRGIARPQGKNCDIGAYELEVVAPTPTATHTPTNTPSPTPSPTPTQPPSGICAGPADGRVGCWKGENNANDSAGTNNGTTQGGAAYAPGKVGQAFSFNGSTGHVLVPDAANLDVTTQFTLSAWIKPAALMNAPPFPGKGAIISKVGGGGGNYGYQYGLADNNAGLWCQFNAQGESWPANQVKANVTGLVPLNAWTHVACTYDNANLTAYLNGTAVGTLAVGAKTVANSASNLRLSSDDNGNVYFQGLIDEAQVWKRALTAQEIADVYNGVSGGGGCTDKPAKPTLKVPANDSIIQTLQPKLKWNEAECAATYDVTIQDAETGQTFIKETGLTKLQYTAPLLSAGRTFKWFVHAVNEHGKTKSAAWTFFIQ